MPLKTRPVLVAALIAGLFSTTAVLAHGGATGVVKERMNLMERLDDAMKALTAVMRGSAPYDAGRVGALATTIADHGGDAMTALFPEGSTHGPSEALPAIWTDWEAFAGYAVQLRTVAGVLGALAGTAPDAPGDPAEAAPFIADAWAGAVDPDALAGTTPAVAIAVLATTCSACHGDFRR